MAGRPLTQINRTVQALMDAVQGGRDQEAKQLFMRLTHQCVDAGIPRPEMPEEVMELAASWQESAYHAPDLPAEPSTDLDMDTRHVLIDAGQMAARRLRDLLHDDSAFGAGGWLPVRQQGEMLNVAMQRAYGQMPSGARFLRLPDGSTGDRQRTEEADERMTTETIGLMVRRRVHRGAGAGEDVVEAGEMADEGDGAVAPLPASLARDEEVEVDGEVGVDEGRGSRMDTGLGVDQQSGDRMYTNNRPSGSPATRSDASPSAEASPTSPSDPPRMRRRRTI